MSGSIERRGHPEHGFLHRGMVECIPVEFADEGAVPHDEGPVGQPDDLGHIRGRHHHGHACGREFGDDAVDLAAGADVDTAGGLVE
jgi:hypothetical protein